MGNWNRGTYYGKRASRRSRLTSPEISPAGSRSSDLILDGCIMCPSTDSTFDLRNGSIKEWFPKNPVLRVLASGLLSAPYTPHHHRKLPLLSLHYPNCQPGKPVTLSIRSNGIVCKAADVSSSELELSTNERGEDDNVEDIEFFQGLYEVLHLASNNVCDNILNKCTPSSLPLSCLVLPSVYNIPKIDSEVLLILSSQQQEFMIPAGDENLLAVAPVESYCAHLLLSRDEIYFTVLDSKGSSSVYDPRPVEEMKRRILAKEAADKEFNEFLELLKSAKAMPQRGKPSKSSWKVEEKIWYRIEFLEAFAIDASKDDAQRNTAGAAEAAGVGSDELQISSSKVRSHSYHIIFEYKVIRGCKECSNCQKVIAKWRPEEARMPDLIDVPVFYPTEKEFKDTLKYISSIREKVEGYVICRIVPPSSWKPPCPL
ncbi:hypothetical protein L2E82_18551 [Cichorium intybus]|uniref:Uncharacterized protein n=1 Tax=Cichorium intybus TaxID=13427 RepID=A0ACB9FA14_CICIN|nr:hypothetical protein L2E82_18551 [Cichorium intybus]